MTWLGTCAITRLPIEKKDPVYGLFLFQGPGPAIAGREAELGEACSLLLEGTYNQMGGLLYTGSPIIAEACQLFISSRLKPKNHRTPFPGRVTPSEQMDLAKTIQAAVEGSLSILTTPFANDIRPVYLVLMHKAIVDVLLEQGQIYKKFVSQMVNNILAQSNQNDKYHVDTKYPWVNPIIEAVRKKGLQSNTDARRLLLKATCEVGILSHMLKEARRGWQPIHYGQYSDVKALDIHQTINTSTKDLLEAQMRQDRERPTQLTRGQPKRDRPVLLTKDQIHCDRDKPTKVIVKGAHQDSNASLAKP